MPKNGWLGMPTSMRFSASPTITFFCFAQVLSPLLRSLPISITERPLSWAQAPSPSGWKQKTFCRFRRTFFLFKKNLVFTPPPRRFRGSKGKCQDHQDEKDRIRDQQNKQGGLKNLTQQTASCQKSHGGIEGTLQNDVPETICRR